MCFQHQRIRSSSFSFCFSHSLKQLIYQTSTLTLGPSTAPALRGPGLPAGTVTVLYNLLYATSRWFPSLLLPPQNPFFPPLFSPLLSSFPPFSIPPVLKRGKMVLTPSKNLFYPSSLPPFHSTFCSGPSTLPSSTSAMCE